MISFEQAQQRIFDALPFVGSQVVALDQACGSVLAQDVIARRTAPSCDLSAMDGYAVRAQDAVTGARLKVIAQSAAGHVFHGAVEQGQAVRIFTGAVLPKGADSILIQENTTRVLDAHGQDFIQVDQSIAQAGLYVRPKGMDFHQGQCCLQSGQVLRAQEIALLAALNYPWVTVARKPQVLLLCTGDELVHPGEPLALGQIISSNGMALKALLEQAGAQVHYGGIIKDKPQALQQALANTEGVDMILTSGGASVGDHDIVASLLNDQGLNADFYKIKMRPGKPLVFGHYQQKPFIGLPGNPVSAMICSWLFVVPALKKMMGRSDFNPMTNMQQAVLRAPLAKNADRKHFMRAKRDQNGTIAALDNQDSSLLSVLCQADSLIVREIDDKKREIGDFVQFIPL